MIHLKKKKTVDAKKFFINFICHKSEIDGVQKTFKTTKE